MTGGIYAGLMSGTSADGIDVALARLDGQGRIERVVAQEHHPLPADLSAAIRASGADASLAELHDLDQRLADAFSDALLDSLDRTQPPEPPLAVGCHGQTVWHTGRTSTPPASIQLADGNRIAARTGLPTVTDFRRRDLAEGGEGAPLTPAFHAHCWQRRGESRTVLNLGGIANITLLPAEGGVSGFDVGPANTLLDHWARTHLERPYDEAGHWASGGKADPRLLERLLADPYFVRPPPKSTGPEHFSPAWLDHHLQGDERPQDVQATLAELTAAAVGDALRRWCPTPPERLWACGGGARNDDLLARLARHCPGCRIATTRELGIEPDYVEALAFAWLAWARLAGHPGSIPEVTGARRAAVLGALYHP